nr:uncharacterized protein LOC107442551 [Parasteatoda tepidariorum]
MKMKTCGDYKKAKEIVVNFGKTSTLHGASRVCLPQKSSKCCWLLYTALMAFCFLSVALIIASLLYDMLNKDSTIINSVNQDFSSGLIEDPQYFPQYPRITLCRNPSFKIDLNETFLSIVEYASLSFGYPFISLTPRETAMIIQLGMVNISTDQSLKPKLNAFKQNLMRQENRYKVLKRMNPHFDLKKFMLENGVRCENFFSHCMASINSFNCCDSFKPILTSFGLCYTFESLTEVDETSRSMDMKFTFIFDLLSPPDIGGAVPRGFSVFFTDPVSEFYIAEASKGEKIFPDKITEISVTLEKTDGGR